MSLKYERVVKLKIFRSLKRWEAGLNSFRIKRVHYGKFGLQIIREPPNFSKPNAPSPFYIKKTHRTPYSFSPRASFLLSVFFFFVSFLSGDDGRPWRRPRAGQTTVFFFSIFVIPHFPLLPARPAPWGNDFRRLRRRPAAVTPSFLILELRKYFSHSYCLWFSF